MSRPVKAKSITAATSVQAGTTIESKGHNSVGLFAVARDLDDLNDTLAVELDASVSDNGEWAVVSSAGGTKPKLTAADFQDPDGDGTYAAFVFSHGVPAPYFRARITSFDDASDSGTAPVADLDVDVWIILSNWSGAGYEFREIT